jgi:hypothetical protein
MGAVAGRLSVRYSRAARAGKNDSSFNFLTLRSLLAAAHAKAPCDSLLAEVKRKPPCRFALLADANDQRIDLRLSQLAPHIFEPLQIRDRSHAYAVPGVSVDRDFLDF